MFGYNFFANSSPRVLVVIIIAFDRHEQRRTNCRKSPRYCSQLSHNAKRIIIVISTMTAAAVAAEEWIIVIFVGRPRRSGRKRARVCVTATAPAVPETALGQISDTSPRRRTLLILVRSAFDERARKSFVVGDANFEFYKNINSHWKIIFDSTKREYYICLLLCSYKNTPMVHAW